MYAIGTAPLIRALSKEPVKQVWYADDASAAGGIKELRRWWDLLVRIGPNYGYYPNASKTWLIVKPDSLLWAQTAFKESGVSITSEGRKHLGAAIGTEAFRRSCYKKGGQLDSGGHEAYSHRRIPTTCCIRSIHSRPLLQVELPFPNHRRHRRQNSSSRLKRQFVNTCYPP